MGYLRHGYTYNENPARSALPLVSFLFGTRQGYCQQFAGSMALLLRMGGVPARVVGGFTTGAYDRTTGQYLVSDLDAHAWVEAWFSGYGWVRFDPTPASAPARAGTVPLPALHGKLGTAPKAAPVRHRDVASATPQSRPGRHAAGGTSLPLVIAVIIALGLIVLTARATTLRRGPGDEAWILELERALARSGRPAAAGLTLAALERRLGSSSPEAAAYVRAIRLGRFGGKSDAPTPAGRRALRAAAAGGARRTRAAARAVGAAAATDSSAQPTRERRLEGNKIVVMEDAYELYRRGTELLDGGHHHQAAIPLARARDLAPDKTSVREALGRALFHTQHYEQAAQEFQAVIDRAPTNDYALFCLGRSLQMLGTPRGGSQAAGAGGRHAARSPRLPALPGPGAQSCRDLWPVGQRPKSVGKTARTKPSWAGPQVLR